MKLHVFGVCAGTEPIAGFHHVSFALEMDNGLYIFDAGEGCSHTAHTMGVDLLKTREIFISHCHMDHVGGLGNLLWNIRKLAHLKKRPPVGGAIGVHIPYLESYQSVMRLLAHTEGDFACDYAHRGQEVADGLVYCGPEDGIQVSAAHNRHLGEPADGRWRSFGYRVQTPEYRLCFSGDTTLADLPALVGEGCDALLMETGHHQVAAVCQALREQRLRVGMLLFLHHGKWVLADLPGAALAAQRLFDGPVLMLREGMTLDLSKG